MSHYNLPRKKIKWLPCYLCSESVDEEKAIYAFNNYYCSSCYSPNVLFDVTLNFNPIESENEKA